jgi:multimeric flavodoxin WrbA
MIGVDRQFKTRDAFVMADVRVVKGMPSVQLDKQQFRERFFARFSDPAFEAFGPEIDKLMEKAWEAYDEYRKSPSTVKAGPDFHNPDFDLAREWVETRQQIQAAEKQQKDPRSPSRILLINGSSRSDHTCPGEMSKTWRLVMIANEVIKAEPQFETDIIDLSRLASEYGKVIYPCKACVSTAQPLCHWPCSCYPNHAIGQVNDWMNEIYPKWVAAHGIMIVTPVNWYQVPSSLKLMIDRLVCADGGNPDPTTTDGKDPAKAKELELKGWPYPRHLAGRMFAVVVHGDASGVENLRRMLSDWLTDMALIPAGRKATYDAYLGYLAPYATSHDDLDRDEGFQHDVRVATLALINGVKLMRSGELKPPDAGLKEARPK